MTRFPRPATPINPRLGNRPCVCCGEYGLTLDADGVCHQCWADAEESMHKRSADRVDGYDRDDLGESNDY